MHYVKLISSPVGEIALSSDGESLTGLWLDGQKYYMATIDEAEAEQNNDLAIFDQAEAWLSRYFKGEDPGALLPLNPHGTEFRQRVWKILCAIPFGGVTTYGEIAQQLAAEDGIEKMSSRAVGGAVGHNPISIIIPCHRVVGSSGSLTGYGGGIKRKIALLELEGVDLSKYSIPTKGTAL